MLFWIFMLLMELLVPATMLGFGYYWQKNPPNRINSAYGYRTKRSMFSEKTWKYAHKVCSGIWRKLGWCTLAVTIAIMIFLLPLKKDIETVGKCGTILVFLQLIPLVLSIPITEHALKKKFPR